MDINDKKNLEYIEKIITEGDILVDVGANQGLYTSFFLNKIGDTGKIISVELHPTTFGTLSEKFLENKNVITMNRAVSDVDGYIEYFAGVDSYTNNIIGHDMSFKKNSKIGDIESVRLDTLLKEMESIKLVKIDVEGAEHMVLEGMSGIVNIVENILVECHLDEYWENIKKILLEDFLLDCHDINRNTEITKNSPRAYQCFCKHKNK